MSKAYHFWTYILTNHDRTVMYTGVTNNLAQRLKEHYDNRGDDKTFAGRYYAYNLVYYEYTTYINNAIYREKEIKNMSKENKMAMITAVNPNWKFLISKSVANGRPHLKADYKMKITHLIITLMMNGGQVSSHRPLSNSCLCCFCHSEGISLCFHKSGKEIPSE